LDTPPGRCHFPSPRATNTNTSFNSYLDQTIPDILPRSAPGGILLDRDSSYSTSVTTFVTENNPYEQEHPPAEIPPQRESQMSWFLTISLLIIVTGVSQNASSLVDESLMTNLAL
jgi:hypothetical protein